MTTVTQADIERTEADTLDHISKVQGHMGAALFNLAVRSARHDASKLEEPERTGYAALQTRLQDIRYGTEEYRQALADAAPVIAHHYAHNDHHPNHYAEGIAGMSLLSLLEMLCDWKAAGERTKEGSIEQSLRVNVERYSIEPQLAAVLYNTAKELGWL